ncbi:MAG: hypothetical protein ISS82_04765 [Nanoarchaeota archaeon]|nr:hypothetical protein [Nanoarchaeota archaeon]
MTLININKSSLKRLDNPDFLNNSIKKSSRILISLSADVKISDSGNKLKEFFDRLIEEDYNFELINFPVCQFLAYKRYIKTIENGINNFDKTKKCKECTYNDVCSGFNKEYLKTFGNKEIHPINMFSIITDNEKCMLTILKHQNKITTKKVLELVKKFTICHDCSTGSHVIAAGKKLIKKGKIITKLTKDGFVWSLA